MKFEQNWPKSFENVNGWMDARTDDRQKVITIAHPEHSSDELINAVITLLCVFNCCRVFHCRNSSVPIKNY